MNSGWFKKGHSVSRKIRNKMRLAKINNKINLGRKHTDKARKNMSDAHIGQIAWNKGKKGFGKGRITSLKTRIKMSNAQRGDKGNNWQGGLTLEKYPREFNNFLKEKIRERDGYKCQKCGVPQIECLRKLAIHHIDYNKKNCNINNLISLCLECNLEVNINRLYWMNYFVQQILQNKVLRGDTD
jgi:hypothetical protein